MRGSLFPKTQVTWMTLVSQAIATDDGKSAALGTRDDVAECGESGVFCTLCAADIDGNNEVNGIDLAIILDKWCSSGGKDYPQADIDGLGTIDASDLAFNLDGWRACP